MNSHTLSIIVIATLTVIAPATAGTVVSAPVATIPSVSPSGPASSTTIVQAGLNAKQAPNDPRVVANETVVVYLTTTDDEFRRQLKDEFGVRFVFPPDAFSTRIPVYVEEQLRSRGDVTVERVARLHIFRETPSDQTPYGIETIYNDTNISTTAGGGGVDVAVIDTGTTREHPDLENRVELCRDYSGGGSGFENDSCDDGHGHGTHVSGTVLADAGDDGKGIYGVAPEADLYAFKVCNNGGLCFGDAIAAAIRDAADENAEIISMSLGGGEDSRIQDAIGYAHGEGTLIVAAAGNSGSDKDTMEYPGADTLVIGVAAADKIDRDGAIEPSNYRIADFSSRGKANDSSKLRKEDGYLEVTGPGVDVLSTWNDGGYNTISGTSMATPHISGLAAKIWSTVGDRDCDGHRNDDVRDELQIRALAFDIEKGKFAGRGYEIAAGLGMPMVESSPNVSPTSGTGVLDGDDDCRRQTHLHDDGDPANGDRTGVVHLTSHGHATSDYALATVDVDDIVLSEIDVEFDYYEGENNSDAAPDEVWLVIENDTGHHIVYRTFNDGSINASETWKNHSITAAIEDSDRPWVEVGISEPVSDPHRALDQLTEDDLSEVGTNLTAAFGADATVLAVGVGHGAPLTGPTTVDLYIDELTVNGKVYEFPLTNVIVENTPLTLDDGTDRVNVTIALEGSWGGRTAEHIDPRTVRLNGSRAIPGSAVIGDFDGDNITELRVQFLKPQIDDDLTSGERVPVTVTGIFADNRTSLSGTDHITVNEG